MIEMKSNNKETKAKLRQIVVDSKNMEERVTAEISEGNRLKEEIARLTRTGRQPAMQGESRKKKQQREDRVSGRSVEEDTCNEHDRSYVDTNSVSDISNNQMFIPEDNNDDHEPCFGVPKEEKTQEEQLQELLDSRHNKVTLKD